MNRLLPVIVLQCAMTLALPTHAQEAFQLTELSEKGDTVVSEQVQSASPLKFKLKPLPLPREQRQQFRGHVSKVGSTSRIANVSKAFGHLGHAAAGFVISASRTAIPLAANTGAMYMIARTNARYGWRYGSPFAGMPISMMGSLPVSMPMPMSMGSGLTQPYVSPNTMAGGAPIPAFVGSGQVGAPIQTAGGYYYPARGN